MNMHYYNLTKDLLQARKRFSERNFDDESVRRYFADTVEQVHNNFMSSSEWQNNYLFSSIGYLNDQKAILTPYYYNDVLLGEYHKTLMENLTQWVNNKGLISITQIFLDPKTIGKHFKALLHSDGNLQANLREFIYVNLSDFKWDYTGTLEQFDGKNFGHYHFHKQFFRPTKDGKGSNPFLKITDDAPTSEQIKQFDKLMAVFAEISKGYANGPCYFYFLKPVTFQNSSNAVLLLGLRKELSSDDIDRWLDKTRAILSVIAEKKLRLDEKGRAEIELFQSLSASTHAIQTNINTLIGSPLNSLAQQYPTDMRVNQLITAKDRLLLDSQLVNLLSKLTIMGDDYKAKENILLKSKFFDPPGISCILLKSFLHKKLEQLKGHDSHKDIDMFFHGLEHINNNFLKYANLFPAERFFELLTLTVFENCLYHAHSDAYRVALDIDIDQKKIVFSNKARAGAEDIDKRQLSGNFLIINTLLNMLKIGDLTLTNKAGRFYVTLQSKSA